MLQTFVTCHAAASDSDALSDGFPSRSPMKVHYRTSHYLMYVESEFVGAGFRYEYCFVKIVGFFRKFTAKMFNLFWLGTLHKARKS